MVFVSVQSPEFLQHTTSTVLNSTCPTQDVVPNLFPILGLASFAFGQNILSTVTSQVTSTNLVCNTILTDTSAVAPLPTVTISTTIDTQPVVRATSTNTPSTFTLTLPAVLETSTLIETTTETFTGSAGTEVFSTTLIEFTTTTDLVPIRATTTEISTVTSTKTTYIATTHVPTSVGYLPIGSTYLNKGVYGDSLPIPAKRDLLSRDNNNTGATYVPSRNAGFLPLGSVSLNKASDGSSLPVQSKRDLLPRGNITIITGDREIVFDEADCICDSDRNIFPVSVECTQVLTVYPHEDVYVEDATPLTTTLPAATSTMVSTVIVIATSTLTPSNIPTTLSITSTSTITETAYTTHINTEYSTTKTTLTISATQSIFAACATGGLNYLGPRFPPKNQQAWMWEPIQALLPAVIQIDGVASVYDCCTLCHMDPLCAVSLYIPNYMACGIISPKTLEGYTEVGVANQLLFPVTMITAREQDWGVPTIAMNGNTGYIWGIVDGYA